MTGKNAPGAKAGRLDPTPIGEQIRTPKDLVIAAKDHFGRARLTIEPRGLRDAMTPTLEVRGALDGQWRVVGSISQFVNRVFLNEDPKADPGDVRRVRALLG